MTPFGDRAVLFPLPPDAARGALFSRLRALPGIEDVVLAETTGLATWTGAPPTVAIAQALAAPTTAAEATTRLHRVPVVYDGEDLAEVAGSIGKSTADVVAMHAGAEHRVALVGFAPGFAYLRGLPAVLSLPRRAPRPRVPAGSVAIAAGYSGIYPFASPGGWHLLGRTSFATFANERATFGLDDRVVFERVDELADPPTAIASPVPAGPHLELTRAQGVAYLVDGGRPGHMHEGIAPGGPLVRAGLAGANARAGNASGTCGLEVYGSVEVTARGGTIAVDGIELADGESHRVASGAARVAYLAVRGGIAGRGFLRGVDTPLRRGARLAIGTAERDDAPAPACPEPGPIALLPGPDGDVLAHLGDLRVGAASDRTGVRLEGYAGPLAKAPADRPSIPMRIGAMELTPSGPIVLGPDHPTTGGYPVVGLVPSHALDAFFARPVGARVSFRAG